MVMYAETVLVPSISSLIKDFNIYIPYSTSSWILTTYLITGGAVMTSIAGKLSDIYGKRRFCLFIYVYFLHNISQKNDVIVC
jgi:MFS family permease